ncbi:MAG: hypothetical protein L0Y55_08555 [Anaerolineales bacterium]|nr:hypothetical protein [Anaerolineales bacterium]
MDQKVYRQFLREFLRDASQKSDGSNAGMASYLMQQIQPGRLARHRDEKIRALNDLNRAFSEHRHWPVDMIFTYLGIKPEEVQGK